MQHGEARSRDKKERNNSPRTWTHKTTTSSSSAFVARLTNQRCDRGPATHVAATDAGRSRQRIARHLPQKHLERLRRGVRHCYAKHHLSTRGTAWVGLSAVRRLAAHRLRALGGEER